MRTALELLSAILERGRLTGDSQRGVLSVEVGGSGIELVTGYFDRPALIDVSASLTRDTTGMHTCFVAPGFVTGGRVRGAHQVSWMDTDAWAELGFQGQPELSMNDAEAAAIGEWLLGGAEESDLVYIGLGTGVGSARVTCGELAAFELGHRPGYGPKICKGCGSACVNGQIGGEVLPVPLTGDALDLVVSVLTAAICDSHLPPATEVILAGGIARAYPSIVPLVRARTGAQVEASRARELKSAASVAMFHRALGQQPFGR